MKNNEMVIRDIISFKLPEIKLPEKFTDDYPGAAVAVAVTPIVITAVLAGVKYFIDKRAETDRFKVLVENGHLPSNGTDGFETISTDESIAS